MEIPVYLALAFGMIGLFGTLIGCLGIYLAFEGISRTDEVASKSDRMMEFIFLTQQMETMVQLAYHRDSRMSNEELINLECNYNNLLKARDHIMSKLNMSAIPVYRIKMTFKRR